MRSLFFILLFVLTVPACAQASAGLKTIEVFGIPVIATEQVPDDKVLHAAKVMAEYLDNDEDGLADNPAVVKELVKRNAFLIMSRDEADEETIRLSDLPQGSTVEVGQNLYAHETFPQGSGAHGFDATLEEVLHLITHVGYANAYPDVWGEQAGTAVARAMDKARGGQFEQIPSSYPESAWYTYNDETCDYSCMVTEYVYWSLTSLLGAQDYAGRLAEIEDEWKLNTRDKVQQQDPDIYALLTNPEYNFATTLPDGDYQGQDFSVQTLTQPSTATPVELPKTTEELGYLLMEHLGITEETAFYQSIDAMSEEEVLELITEALEFDTVTQAQRLLESLVEEVRAGEFVDDEAAQFTVKGEQAFMAGVIGASTPERVQKLVQEHPEVKTIVMTNVPGSDDDEANLQAARLLRQHGLYTHVPADGIIASGGVDFFLAGVKRRVDTGAQLGVHSWGAGPGEAVATELPKDDPQHQLYLSYYEEMAIPSAFYWFTLEAAPAEDIHWMTGEEIERFQIER